MNALGYGGGLGFGIQLSLTNYKFPGDNCFSGGLLGPDGTNWHLGKWCKKAQRKESTTLSTGLQGSNASTGNLIAVGADGRGGRIKVLRSLGQSSSVGISSHSWVLLLQKTIFTCSSMNWVCEVTLWSWIVLVVTFKELSKSMIWIYCFPGHWGCFILCKKIQACC